MLFSIKKNEKREKGRETERETEREREREREITGRGIETERLRRKTNINTWKNGTRDT